MILCIAILISLFEIILENTFSAFIILVISYDIKLYSSSPSFYNITPLFSRIKSFLPICPSIVLSYAKNPEKTTFADLKQVLKYAEDDEKTIDKIVCNQE